MGTWSWGHAVLVIPPVLVCEFTIDLTCGFWHVSSAKSAFICCLSLLIEVYEGGCELRSVLLFSVALALFLCGR